MRFFSVLFLCLFVFSAQAQVKLPPKQVEQKAPVKQTVTEVKPVNTGPVFTLKVMSNVGCKFYVDGELKATVAQDEIEKLQLKAGEYMFKAVATENNTVVFKEFFTVTKEQIGTEKFYKIDLQSVIDEADQEAAAKRAAAQRIAEQKAAAQKIEFERAEEKLRQENAEAEREAKRLEYEQELIKNVANLKHFEGKISFEADWENVPEDMKAYYKKSTYSQYYKKNKLRIEINSTETSKTVFIYDYIKKESLTLSEFTIAGKTTKSATLQKTNTQKNQTVSMEYFDEFKSIAGFNCQKAKYKVSGNDNVAQNIEMSCYVNRSFTTPGEGFNELNITPFLMMDSKYPTKIGQNTAYYNASVSSISEEILDDELFSLTPPRGFTITDNR